MDATADLVSLEKTFGGDWKLAARRGEVSEVALTGYSVHRHLLSHQHPHMHVTMNEGKFLEVTEQYKDASVMHKAIPLVVGESITEEFRGAAFNFSGEVGKKRNELKVTSSRAASDDEACLVRWFGERDGSLSISVYVKGSLVLAETWVRSKRPPPQAVLPPRLQHVPTMASLKRNWIPRVEEGHAESLFILDLGLNAAGSRVMLKKRYSQFVSLHWTLRFFFDEVENFTLPGRATATLSRREILETRRSRLDAFVALVMKITPLPAAFVRFIADDSPNDKNASTSIPPHPSHNIAPNGAPLWSQFYDAVVGGTSRIRPSGYEPCCSAEDSSTVAAFLHMTSLACRVEYAGGPYFTGGGSSATAKSHDGVYRLRITFPGGFDNDGDDDIGDVPASLLRDTFTTSSSTATANYADKTQSSNVNRTIRGGRLRFENFAKIHQFLVKECVEFADERRLLSDYFEGLTRLRAAAAASSHSFENMWLWNGGSQIVETHSKSARRLSVYFRHVFRSCYQKLSFDIRLRLFQLLLIPTAAAVRIIDCSSAEKPTAHPAFSLCSPKRTKAIVPRRALAALSTFEVLCRRHDYETAKSAFRRNKVEKSRGDEKEDILSKTAAKRLNDMRRSRVQASNLGTSVPAKLHFNLSKISGLSNVRQISVIFRFGEEERRVHVNGDSFEDGDINERVTFNISTFSPFLSFVGKSASTDVDKISANTNDEARSNARLMSMKNASGGCKDKIVVVMDASVGDDDQQDVLCCAVIPVTLPLEAESKKVQLRAFDKEDIATGVTVVGFLSAEPSEEYNCLLVYQERVGQEFVGGCIGANFGVDDCSFKDNFFDQGKDSNWQDIGCVMSSDLVDVLTFSEEKIWSSLTLQHSAVYKRSSQKRDQPSSCDGWVCFDPTWVYSHDLDAVSWSIHKKQQHYRRQLWCQSLPTDKASSVEQAWRDSINFDDVEVDIRSMRANGHSQRACFF